MDKTIKSDLFRYEKRKGWKGFISGLCIPGFRYTFLLRKCSKYSKINPLGFIYRILLYHYSFRYAFQINPGTVIGEGLYIGHFGTIVINGNAVLGKNCNLANGVTIGQENRGIRKGSPIIGDKVWIGTNAIVVGNINIGNNVLIAPNAFVNCDIPSNSIAVGNPVKIIHHPEATKSYIEHVLPS